MRKSITTLIFFLVACITNAQNFASIRSENEPLQLRAIGSFYIGGEKQLQSSLELGGFSSDGHITINQMYVNYMIPQELKDSISFTLL